MEFVTYLYPLQESGNLGFLDVQITSESQILTIKKLIIDHSKSILANFNVFTINCYILFMVTFLVLLQLGIFSKFIGISSRYWQNTLIVIRFFILTIIGCKRPKVTTNFSFKVIRLSLAFFIFCITNLICSSISSDLSNIGEPETVDSYSDLIKSGYDFQFGQTQDYMDILSKSQTNEENDFYQHVKKRGFKVFGTDQKEVDRLMVIDLVEILNRAIIMEDLLSISLINILCQRKISPDDFSNGYRIHVSKKRYHPVSYAFTHNLKDDQYKEEKMRRLKAW